MDSSESVRCKRLTIAFILVVVKVVTIEDEGSLFEGVGVERFLLQLAFAFKKACKESVRFDLLLLVIALLSELTTAVSLFSFL